MLLNVNDIVFAIYGSWNKINCRPNYKFGEVNKTAIAKKYANKQTNKCVKTTMT
jgi:hypothetical protein